MCPIKIEQVKQLVLDNLPDCWMPVEASLSVIGAALLRDVDHCVGLIIEGQPGGRKSTTIELLGRAEPIYYVDDFTPASFVSHDASKTTKELVKIDLLPVLQHRILVVPELAPMFGQRYEDLMKNIAILTRVMDGKGYKSRSGVHGERGYEGDYRFNMIAATVPIPHQAWQALGKLSSRWVLCRLEEATGEGFDLRGDFGSKKAVCNAIIQPFIKDLWSGFASVPWNRAGDNKDLTTLLTQSAQLICKWRGIVQRQDASGYNPALVEVPYRLAETLYALARGHALLWGRSQIEDEDAFFAIEVNTGNMPEDRARLYKAFMQKGWENFNELITSTAYHSGKLSPNEIAETLSDTLSLREVGRVIGCSPDTAKRILDELMGFGVVEHDPIDGDYRWIV